MSLRRYLFLLVGCLIVVMTTTQLIIINWIESNLAKEVNIQARQFTEQIIDLAVNQLEEHTNDTLKNKSPRPINRSANTDHNIEVIELDDIETNRIIKHVQDGEIHVFEHNIESNNSSTLSANNKKLANDFKLLVENLHNEKAKLLSSAVEQTFIVHSPSKVVRTKVTKTPPLTEISSLFNKIQLVLILVGVMGLVFAYWLSTQFNRPLKGLTQGFRNLAQGNYQTQVKEQGVYELRQTIRHFNEMTKKVRHLSKAEQKHQEVAHLAELGEVSRGLAHALRSPIHTIGLSIEQLIDDDVPKLQKHELLRTVQYKISNIDKSIKALLTLTTTGISRNESIPVLAVVQDIILEYKSTVTKEISFNIEVEKGLSIIGAESEIRSILHTLINNACEACNTGGTVLIKAKFYNDETVVQVYDQGSGIAPQIEKELFNPHVSSKAEGAGMGLYIARRLLTLHYNGTLSLNNQYDNNQQIIGAKAEAHFKGNS